MEEIEKQKLKDEQDYIKFAETLTDPKGNLVAKSTSLGNADSKRIERMLEDPVSNYVEIASLMNALVRKNGTVGSTVRYFASHLTYNHTIYSAPNEKSGFTANNSTLEDYLGAATLLDSYGVKRMAPYFARQVFINGMAFFYEIKDSKGVGYMEFPIGWGRISSYKNGVYRWELDISQLKDELIPYMPNEIQKAYEQMNGNSALDEKRWREGKYYRLSDKGVAFCINPEAMTNAGIAISDFASLLIDSLRLEKAKNNTDLKDELDAVRLIHGKIPLDKDNKPTIPAKAADRFNQQIQRGMPSGVVAVSNPFEMTNIPLSGSGATKSYEIVDKAQQQIFLSTGTPSSLFGGETTSSNIVKLTLEKDSSWLYSTIIPMIQAYYDSVLSSFKSSSGQIFKTKFLRQSNFTLDNDVKRYKEAVTMGGSRLDYLASLGVDPLEVYSKLIMEQQVLNIDSFMIPKQTSFTLSGESGDGDGAGRPVASEPTDDTERISDSQ